MKKILLVAILICAISALSFAGTASTSANVTAAVTVTNNLPMAFGNVTLGTSPIVAANTGAAAAFTISGAANTATGVTIVYPATLVSGANSMVFTSSVLPRTNTVAAAATAVTNYSPDASDVVGALTSGTGALFLYVGGQIAVDPAQAAGSYSGTITVTVTQ